MRCSIPTKGCKARCEYTAAKPLHPHKVTLYLPPNCTNETNVNSYGIATHKLGIDGSKGVGKSRGVALFLSIRRRSIKACFSFPAMASDQVYHHQVDVDDAAYSESSESVESSDMEQHAPQTEVIEDATAAGGWQASPPPRLRQQQVAAASSDDAQPPPPRQRAPSVRAIKNLEVEVNGPTEDVRSRQGIVIQPFDLLLSLIFLHFTSPT